MRNIMYWTDGRGFWLRREWAPQCKERVFLAGRCQGVKGHKGDHWCYSLSGDYRWSDNDEDPQHDGSSGSTPPDHPKYVAPLERQKDYHVSHYTDVEVTDPEIIAGLEKGKAPERNASINRPLSPEENRRFREQYPDRL